MSDVKRYNAGNLTSGEVVMAADYDALLAKFDQAWKSASSESHAWAREYEARMLVVAERDQLRAEVEKRQLTIDGMNEKHWELVQAHAQLRAELEAISGQETVARQAKCTNEDSWNCKYCRKTETCEALQDKRNFGAPAPPPAARRGESAEGVAAPPAGQQQPNTFCAGTYLKAHDELRALLTTKTDGVV